MIEVNGIDGHSVMLSKRAILKQPETLLGEIFENDDTATAINLQLDRTQLEFITSFFVSEEPASS
jgi:hypothetical protein